MIESYEKEREVAKEAVRRAAGVCRAVQAQIETASLEKRDRSPVTVADYASQALICGTLAQAFPGDPIIAEEDATALRRPEGEPFLEQVHAHLRGAGSLGREEILTWIDRGGTSEYRPRFWTLDPVDGTKGFLRREQYAVALALIVEGRPVVAALACPNLPIEEGMGALFVAVAGQGCTMEPVFGGDARVVRVAQTTDPKAMRFCESVESGHSAHDVSARVASSLGIQGTPVRLDSQAKYGIVARGDAEIYLRLPTRADYNEKIWDHAAGVLVVQEAGGRVTDIAGNSLDFTCGRELSKNRGVIVSHGKIHDRLLEAVRAARPGGPA